MACPDAPKSLCDSSLGSGGECPGFWGLVLSSSVLVEGEAVDHERVAEQVQELTGVAETVGASEPETVVECAVD